MKLRVGVVFGGNSVEHEISVISAIQAMNSMDKEKYEIIPIYISKDMLWYYGSDLGDIANYKDLNSLIKRCKHVNLCKKNGEFCLVSVDSFINRIIDKVDIIFPIVHGKNVEDGSLAGYLETVGVPYVGSGVLGSSIGQDKVVLKQLLSACDVSIADYVWFYDWEYMDDRDSILKKIDKLGYPVVVKPACLGSSVGIKFVKNKDDICEAIEDAISYDKKVLIEKGVSNLVEVNCSVVGDYHDCEVSATEQVSASHDILTYDDKYVGNGKGGNKSKGIVNTDRIIPANLDKKLIDEVERLSLAAFRALNLSGVVRIDYLIDMDTEKVYLNEPNIIPGSLSFYLWEAKGVKYKELLDRLIELGMKNYKETLKKVNSFETSVLSNYNTSNGSKNKLKG